MQIAELPGFAVRWDRAGTSEDVGVAVRTAGPGARIGDAVGGYGCV